MSSDQYSEKPLPAGQKRCCDCGQLTPARSGRCWLCQEQFALQEGNKPKPDREPSPLLQEKAGAWAVLLIALILVCVGLTWQTPGVLVVSLLVIVPVIFWFARKDTGGFRELILGLGAIGIAFLVGLAGLIAFAVICASAFSAH